MPKRRKEGNKFTTISISWKDKDMLRTFAKFKRDTKNGKLYETDAEVFNRLLNAYDRTTPNDVAHSTYPTVLQDKHQQD